jgi:CubicO group peptidase (beta-lactamase class C family)
LTRDYVEVALVAGLQISVADIDRFVERQMTLGRTPGLALALYGHGEVLLEKGYGHADVARGTPMTERTPVVIGSTTKAMTAAAVLRLIEAGSLDLDAPITTYLPHFRLAEDGAAERITLRHLLSHTAGLPPTPRDAPSFVPPRGEKLVDVYLSELAWARPLWTPGEGWLYANDGYTLAGRIIEAVSGRSYAEYVTEEIFRPLGMDSARFAPTPQPDTDIAAAYDYDGNGDPFLSYFPFDRSYAPGMAIMDAHDALRWLRVMLGKGELDGVRIISEASYSAMTTSQVEGPLPMRGATGMGGYGFGWAMDRLEDALVISHGGSCITMGSQFLFMPEEDLAVAVLANSGTAVTPMVAEGVLSLARGAEPPRSFPEVDRSFQPDRSLWPMIAGMYHAAIPNAGIPGPMPIKYDGHSLVAHTYPAGPNNRAGDIFLAPTSDTTFVLFGRGATGAQASFDIEGFEVKGALQDIPIVKIADQIHAGYMMQWPDSQRGARET